ncbi:hypothetical protein [Thioclava sp. GXIMD4215]|uniref:hypothetical protein n=1 Tax=Thioclava sp. GXIMD4215 TaxID=3131928 RepID=UPI00311ADE91
MKHRFDDLFKTVPARDKKGRTAGAATHKASINPATALDKTSSAAWEILDEEAEIRAQKTARLKAAREAQTKPASEE